jgi:hypothetical protein
MVQLASRNPSSLGFAEQVEFPRRRTSTAFRQ